MSLEDDVAALRHELGVLQDIQAVRTLQFKYGFYMDKCLFGAIVDLFADDAELHFMGGVFKGKEGARRLYGGGTGLNGPADGLLFEHFIGQDIVDVAPDRRTAKGRFRCFLLGGVHETHPNPPPNIPKAFWEGGLYENDYVRDGETWKIKRFDYRVVWQANYADGWSRSPTDAMMIAPHAACFPENPRGPDTLEPLAPRWPRQGIHPFHYPHPVTGEPVTGPA